jgi:hypothetical protein
MLLVQKRVSKINFLESKLFYNAEAKKTFSVGN